MPGQCLSFLQSCAWVEPSSVTYLPVSPCRSFRCESVLSSRAERRRCRQETEETQLLPLPQVERRSLVSISLRGKNRNVREQKFQNKVCLGRTPQLARGRWEIQSCGHDSWCWSETFTQLCITHTCNPWTLCIKMWLVSLCFLCAWQTWHWVQ